MNKQILVIGVVITLFGAYLFSLSSVTVLSEFDVIPVNSFMTYYADVETLPLPMANYQLELLNTNQGPEFRDGIQTRGDIIDLYVFDDENYGIFKGCGGQRGGDESCTDWEPIVQKLELTGTFRRVLPEMEKITVVVWNHNMEETVENSISIRLESNYSGIANILVIIGLLVFYIGASRKEEKIVNKRRKERKE
ncbi:MAG: hypothetical protein HS049_02085 [Thaumarchaeota archaeon]|nr:hypothetical protein [Nitrososphaerota archaeon]